MENAMKSMEDVKEKRTTEIPRHVTMRRVRVAFLNTVGAVKCAAPVSDNLSQQIALTDRG